MRNRRRCRAGLTLVLSMLAPMVVIAQEPKAAPKAKKTAMDSVSAEQIEAAKRRSERLFASEVPPLAFSLVADYKEAFRSRDTLNVKRSKATLIVANDSGRTASIAVEIEPRGHFRLLARNCAFPPLRIIFPKSGGGLKGTPFAGQEALKLGTHCRPGDREYEEIPVREHAIYRTYGMFTDLSFKSRLARVTYVDARDTTKREVKTGLLIESEEDVGKRNGGRVAELRGARFDDIEPSSMTLLGVFEFFIGNTDFSLYSLHNIRLLQRPDLNVLAVPYDFDWSGAADTRYAVPNALLGIKNVKDRLYRGPCRTLAEMKPVLAQFTAKRDAIRALYAALPLDKSYQRWVLDYYEEFFRLIGNDGRIRRELIDACAQRPTVDAGVRDRAVVAAR